MEDFIFGRNNVLELLQNGKRNVSKILLMQNCKENSKLSQIVEMARNRGIVFQFIPKEKFIKYKDYAHQGVIAYVSPVNYTSFDDFLLINKANKKVIVTDGIEDPHNMGSIIRTAVCAGFDAVIFPSRRNAVINATVEKSSAGAINHIDLIMVNSLSSTIDKLKDNDFWIIATDINAKDNYYDIDYCNMNFAIIMGSEKDGVSTTILKKSDYKIKIPMLRKFDSLNVANAASIVIYEAVKQIIQKSGNIV
ncbi:TPA: 23S rRNA (guanosine(2251)-2'-O)-methyltransferase RlmB [Candidatus Avigastranaerophilus faecigallinarum]|nr:23S rRNA (guanosine(2251)-2'-O)-methyltransferase RlmB [Candidatus Avigastranaerophilus faecigallinarum]